MKKKRLLFLLLIILLVFFLILFFYTGKKLIDYYFDNRENHIIQTKTREYIKVLPKEEELSYEINFEGLKKLNPDTVAYLKVNGTDIDYVVVQGENNEYYLKHNFYQQWNDSGWIFGDYRNRFDGEDKNIVIYGHNTNDGSMFGTLKNVLKDEWNDGEENLIITLALEDRELYYHVFSTYVIPPEDYYITTRFQNSKEFMKYIDTISKRSYYNYSVSINEGSKILTLSTCTQNGKNRVVLHGVLTGEAIKQNSQQ